MMGLGNKKGADRRSASFRRRSVAKGKFVLGHDDIVPLKNDELSVPEPAAMAHPHTPHSPESQRPSSAADNPRLVPQLDFSGTRTGFVPQPKQYARGGQDLSPRKGRVRTAQVSPRSKEIALRQALPEGETDGVWYSETVVLQTEKNLMTANPVFLTVALRDDDVLLVPVTKNDNGKLSIGMRRNHEKDPASIPWASITKAIHTGSVLPTCNWTREYIPHLWDTRDRMEQRAFMSIPVVQQVASSRIDLYIHRARTIARPSFLPSDNVRLFTFQRDTKLGEYLCRAWLQGHRRYVASIPATLEPKSTSANLRYVERVVNVLDQGEEKDGGYPLDAQAAMLRKFSGRVLECRALRAIALKSQRLRTRTFDILAKYQGQFDASECAVNIVALQTRLCAALALLYALTEESGLLTDRQSLLHPAPYTLGDIIGLVGQEFAVDHDAFLNTDQDDWEGEKAEEHQQIGAEARLLQEIRREKMAATMAKEEAEQKRKADAIEAGIKRRREARLRKRTEGGGAADSPASPMTPTTPAQATDEARDDEASEGTQRGVRAEMDAAHHISDVLRRLQTAVLVHLIHTCLDSNKVDLTLEWRIPRHLFLTPEEVIEDLANMVCLQVEHHDGPATSANETYAPPDLLDYSAHPALCVSVACSYCAQLFCLMMRWANRELKMLDAHTPVVQFFASKRHHKILFHGNKLDRITGRMMDEEIKRRQLKLGHSAEEMAQKAAEKEKDKQNNKKEGIVIDKGEIEAGRSLV